MMNVPSKSKQFGLKSGLFFIWKNVQDDRGKMMKCRSETEKFVT